MNQVTIYTTPTCIWCNRAKSYLREQNISFVEKDVSRDREAATEMIRKTNQMGVPVLDINGNVIIGFDQHGINRLLGL
ncbi:glutathione S-transferase N-terminal domain-containing protein [Proteiniclasticum sp. SCR006]|uniref:Glutathione S-transferase N-terminal domain-containing protein n=1 Tax=Proteiniclasticum aestuarii TaxID=2817862 RepID=A0A939H4N6_9CLOT|nr:glutaredoxin domain-containing protein [Proteiniclasticum aestuarii]MBO1264099.1 glutathione S-transferase N-terminal domain-containing protein [Proteiniclasticum aestuarii]